MDQPCLHQKGFCLVWVKSWAKKSEQTKLKRKSNRNLRAQCCLIEGGGAVIFLPEKKLHNSQMWKRWDWEINAVKLQEKQKSSQFSPQNLGYSMCSYLVQIWKLLKQKYFISMGLTVIIVHIVNNYIIAIRVFNEQRRLRGYSAYVAPSYFEGRSLNIGVCWTSAPLSMT